MAKMKHNRRYNKESVKRLKNRLKTAQNKKPVNRAYREMSSLEKAIAILLDEVGVEWLREHPLPYTKGHWRYYRSEEHTSELHGCQKERYVKKLDCKKRRLSPDKN